MSNLQEVLSQDCSAESVSETPPSRPKPRRSMRKAINDYCKDCTYDPEFKGGGTWREQTQACTVTKCALFEFRPISKPRKVETFIDDGYYVDAERMEDGTVFISGCGNILDEDEQDVEDDE